MKYTLGLNRFFFPDFMFPRIQKLSKMGRKRKQAADYAAGQPDSLEVVKQVNVCAAVCGRGSVQSA